MGSLKTCLDDLEKTRQLVRVKEEVNPHLEIAEIQRRAYLQKAPAILFERVMGTPFPCVSNLFGTKQRTAFIFRKTLNLVSLAVKMKADPAEFFKRLPQGFLQSPGTYARLPFAGLTSLPRRTSARRAPVMACQTMLENLPAIQSWPMDGGPFITLPQVLSQDCRRPGIMGTNLGMYRVQLSGNLFEKNREVGIHYQIHRGIGIHHSHALAEGKPFRVSIFVGGHPAHTVAAVMPLPEGLSELIFAGMLAGQRYRYVEDGGHIIAADADFCIVGTVMGTKPEGPFGDHLGYYSLEHDFPVLQVERVYHRADAIWPFTVVGRPPQEDTTFGELIHEITGPMVPVSLPGVRELHAVDAAGVHPLLLAIGSERYTPYQKIGRPQELLTQAHEILGFNQCSLAKYLFIVNGGDSSSLTTHDIGGFLTHLFERVDLTNDLHFHTRTTMDTLDYSGEAINRGSKLVIAAQGQPRRTLARSVPAWNLPQGFNNPRVAHPGVLVIEGPPFSNYQTPDLQPLCEALSGQIKSEKSRLADQEIVLIVVCDDSAFCAQSFNNFIWVTFTRSNPSHDCHGVGHFVEFKHWGCKGPLVIDARLKPHHAPPLVEDPVVTRKVDQLCAPGGSLHGVLN